MIDFLRFNVQFSRVSESRFNAKLRLSHIQEGCGKWECIPILHKGGMWGMEVHPHPAYRRDVGNGNISPSCIQQEGCGEWECIPILHAGGMWKMGTHPTYRRDVGNGNASPSCMQEGYWEWECIPILHTGGMWEWIPILHAGGIWEMGMHPLAELPVIKNCAVFLTQETVLAPPNFVLKSAFS